MIADEILSIYANQGAGAYLGEPVSVNEHALQSAYFAEAAGASVPWFWRPYCMTSAT